MDDISDQNSQSPCNYLRGAIRMMSDINGGTKSPTQTQVTVTTDPGPNPQSIEIRLNVGYFKTPSGIVKLVELVRRS